MPQLPPEVIAVLRRNALLAANGGSPTGRLKSHSAKIRSRFAEAAFSWCSEGGAAGQF